LTFCCDQSIDFFFFFWVEIRPLDFSKKKKKKKKLLGGTKLLKCAHHVFVEKVWICMLLVKKISDRYESFACAAAATLSLTNKMWDFFFLQKKKSKKEKKPAPSAPSAVKTTRTDTASSAKSIDEKTMAAWSEEHKEPTLANEEEEDGESGEDFVEGEGVEAVVLHDYTPVEKDEISLEKDQIIIVYEMHDSGWWTGESKDSYGLFPGAFVRLLDAENDQDDQVQQEKEEEKEKEKDVEKENDEEEETKDDGDADEAKKETVATDAADAPKPSKDDDDATAPAGASAGEPAAAQPAVDAAAAVPKKPAPPPDEIRELVVTQKPSEAKSSDKAGGSSASDDVESLKQQIESMAKQIEELTINKELEEWQHTNAAPTLRKEVGSLKEQLAKQQASFDSERKALAAAHERTKAELARARTELGAANARIKQVEGAAAKSSTTTTTTASAPSAQPAATTSVPIDMMEQFRQMMAEQSASMQRELAELKAQVSSTAPAAQAPSANDFQLAAEVEQLKLRVDNEAKERSKLRSYLIGQITESAREKITKEVLERAQVRDGKLWDPVNNVFLAQDGKWLRPTGKDLQD
jgi:SH3 domain